MSVFEWAEYKCESGQTLFIFNKVTGEHFWPSKGVQQESIIRRPISFKKFCSIATQTDDYGCENGCSSMSVNTSHVINCLDISSEREIAASSSVGKSSHMNVQLAQEPLQNMEDISLAGGLDDLEVHSKMEQEENKAETLAKNSKAFQNDSDKQTMDNQLSDLNRNDSECLTRLNVTEDSMSSVRMSHGTKNECGICKKVFKRKVVLNDHLRVHTGEKPFECPLCPKHFKQKSHLRYHLIIHRGEKPYECPHCKRKFRHPSHLKTHIRIHTGETPFECTLCDKKFRQNSHLTAHYFKGHSGIRP